MNASLQRPRNRIPKQLKHPSGCSEVLRAGGLLGGLAALGGEKLALNEGKDTTLRDGDTTKELIQLLIVPDGELKVTWNDTRLLVVTGSVTGKLENLGSKVLENSGEVNWTEKKTECKRGRSQP